jgi:DNA recombination protein RmuC
MEITLEVVVVLFLVVLVIVLGAAVAVLALRGRARPDALAEEMRRYADEQRRASAAERDAAIHAAVQQVVTSGKAVLDAERELAGRDLRGERTLIDQRLDVLDTKLFEVSTLMRELEAGHEHRHGELTKQLSLHGDGVTALVQTTQSLREALSSTKARGQWGERMAEDVLRLAGFIENVQYRKQKALQGGGGIPDYTFFLPNDLLLHMDVKFPLDNYLRYCEATSDLDRKRFRDDFLRDVRARVKELSSRDYIDPTGGTVDFVLLFIPNEQLYSFLHEHDGALLDEAVRQRVVFCSPLTLFAVVALIRQMVENFQLAKTSDEILALLGEFIDQWGRFKTQMEKVGQRIDSAGKEYEALVGTRTRGLEKPLLKIEQLRGPAAQLSSVSDDEPGDPPLALEA